MRYLIAIVSCLMFLALAGQASAARPPVDCLDSPTAMQTGSMDEDGCCVCPDKGRKCDHDACCGYYVAALPDVVNSVTPFTPRPTTEAPGVKHLAGSGRDTLLDPPRA
jgi:hypothetical protein